MDKTKYLKKPEWIKKGRTSGKIIAVGGAIAVEKATSPQKGRIVIGANPPQKLTAEAKKKLEDITPDLDALKRVASHAAASKVKKKISYDF